MTETNVINRKKFCTQIMEDQKYYQHIFFTDEKIFSLEKNIHQGHNYIRLSKDFKLRLSMGDPEVERLVHTETPKFSSSFMVAGGISVFGPGKLIFLSGNMDSKAYKKVLEYYKEDIDYIVKTKNCSPILFQQDNAPCHTSNQSKEIIKSLFYKQIDYDEIGPEPKKDPRYAKGHKIAKEMFEIKKDEYSKKKRLFEEKFISENKYQEFLIENWPANSPVN